MEKLSTRIGLAVSDWKIPRDGTSRYLYDIWQPLTLLMLTTCFTATFFANYDPYALTDKNDLFFCNADGNVEKTDFSYRPFWDSRLYFTINVAFGEFGFSTVKSIDAVWDLFVGRGGQMVAVFVAYRPLRRSFALTMETCTVAIPTVASLYYQQIQLVTVGRLVSNIFRHWGSQALTWRQLRMSIQVFTCFYALSFATLASVMTGYRAQLTSYFGFQAGQASQLQPTSQLTQPMASMVVYNGSRIGQSDAPIFPHEELPFLDDDEQFNISEILDRSSEIEEPFGTFIDYYYTCLGLRDWINGAEKNDSYARWTEPWSLECASHDCSCSFDNNNVTPYGWPTEHRPEFSITSNITIDGKSWPLQAPPLHIGLASYDPRNYPQTLETWFSRKYNSHYSNAREFWSGLRSHPARCHYFLDAVRQPIGDLYMMGNGTGIDRITVKQSGRCIAQDAYSWGFSSLLLLTFCCDTILFALALILLQTDVYWNSRHGRDHQFHSMYTDVLYLGEELKAIFGGDVKDHLESPKVFSKRVESYKQGLRLSIDELPLSRWQEWRLSRATKGAKRKNRASTVHTESLSNELHPVISQSRDQLETFATADQQPSLQSSVEPASSDQGQSSAAVSMLARASASEEQGLITHAPQTYEAEEEPHPSSLPPHNRQ